VKAHSSGRTKLLQKHRAGLTESPNILPMASDAKVANLDVVIAGRKLARVEALVGALVLTIAP